MSNMSTRIDDLPGPQPNEPGLPDDIQQDIQELNQLQDSITNTNTNSSQTSSAQKIEPYESNIKADIRKRVRFAEENKQEPEGIFDIIKTEINEENLLLLGVLLIASTPTMTEYIERMIPGHTSDGWTMMLFKAALMLILFIVSKRYLLPYIKI